MVKRQIKGFKRGQSMTSFSSPSNDQIESDTNER